MADSKITDYSAMTVPALADLMEIVDDPGGTPANQKITLQNMRAQLMPHAACGGRLTLTTGVPVTTADVTGAATFYFTPYSGSQFCGQIGLYDGSSKWDVLDFTEASLSLVGYTASKPYDIWAYNNSGTVALESTVWTNDTTRATALAVQDGIYVKTGATTRRYLGTIYINSSGGQTDDTSAGKRNVFNYYNRVWRTMHKEDGNAHTYNATAGRFWNNDSTLFFEWVQGVQEGMVQGNIKVLTTGSASNPRAFLSLDSNTFDNNYPFGQNNSATLALYDSSAVSIPAPAVGRHFLAISEALQTGSTSSTFTTVFADVAVLG